MEAVESREVALRSPEAQTIELAPLPVGNVALALIRRAGPNAWFAADEFFKATISNEHTRRAYCRAVNNFLLWCQERGVELQQVTPGAAGEYLAGMNVSAPTKNQNLAALRRFFDCLVNRHAVVLNAFGSVRGVKHEVVEGKTAEISVQQARDLFKSIDISTAVGLRDKTILGVLAYTGARVGAVAKLRLGDYRDLGAQKVLRFREKGGKDREIPVRHDLEEWLHEYITAAALSDENRNAPLFRAAEKNRPVLTGKPFNAHLIRQMLKRRLEDAGLPDVFSPHSFRVTVVTDLLKQNIPLEDVQFLAGHSSPTTTRIYDRRRRKVTRNIVERISI